MIDMRARIDVASFHRDQVAFWWQPGVGGGGAGSDVEDLGWRSGFVDLHFDRYTAVGVSGGVEVFASTAFELLECGLDFLIQILVRRQTGCLRCGGTRYGTRCGSCSGN